MEGTNEFQDWELLQSNSDSEPAPVVSPDSGNSFEEIDSVGLIQTNYFSLDSQDRHVEGLDDDKSAESDNPSWIDPGLEEDPARYLNKEPGAFWSDSSSERSEDRKISELEGIPEMGFCEKGKKEPNFEGIGELREEKGGNAEDLEKIHMGSSGIEEGSAELSDSEHKSPVLVESEGLSEEKKIESGGGVINNTGDKKSGELEKRSLVWWKMPMEFLKYYVVRMSPVWSISVAAAFMGFVILGRRLYKMKKKTRGLEIKVTVDDKKVSQVMSRAARLNEAFSVVKRVPVIRPALPAVGSTGNWPVLSMR
ncbi:hypothetical protein ACS0TY_027889 [Phlomoides rotata]